MPTFSAPLTPGFLVINPEEECPTAFAIADNEPLGNGLMHQGVPAPVFAQVFFPTEGGNELPSQPDAFPLMVFTPGNGHIGTLYGHVDTPLANRGVIAISLDGGTNVGGPLRAHRLMCVAEAVLDEHVTWIGTGRLSGEVLFGGHSQGGRGAYLAARDSLLGTFVTANQHQVVGVFALAPAAETEREVEVGANGPFFFIMAGSGDGDTTTQPFSIYDAIRPVEVQGEIVSAARKALVWGYGIDHSHWGGKDKSQTGDADESCLQTPRALALVDAYLGAFVDAAVYNDLVGSSLFFDATQPTPVIPQTVANPELWSEFGGEPQVYGTSSERIEPTQGYEGWSVDRFENADKELSDSGLDVQVAFPNSEESANGGGGLLVNEHITRVALVELSQDLEGNFADSIEWCLSCDASRALAAGTTLTYRIGFERNETDSSCSSGETFPLPSMRVVLEDYQGSVWDVDVSEYARLALPDTRELVDECSATGKPCDSHSPMQATVRIPLAAFCDSGMVLADIARIRFEFSSPNPVESGFGTLLIFDDVEIHRVPGEPNVACRCG